MCGWLVLLVALLLIDAATGSLVEESDGELEDSTPPVPPVSTTHVCTEDDTTRTVKCRNSREESGISMCCSLTWKTVSSAPHFRPTHPPCTSSGASAPADTSSNTDHNATRHSTPTNCTLSIPAISALNRRKRPLVAYELNTCEGSNLEVRCRTNLSCSDRGVAWRREGAELPLEGRGLKMDRVRRSDSGVYYCEVTDYFGKKRIGAVVSVSVQFPPTLTSPAPIHGRPAECTSEASPPATITWYRDDTPLSPTVHHTAPFWYIVTSETEACLTKSRLRLLPMPEENGTEVESGNFSCVATNRHGAVMATIVLPAPPAEPSDALPADYKRRFNVTGFIVGMLPPLFISFYIILKLGYRSRYAEERGEDDGYRDEPFFIGY